MKNLVQRVSLAFSNTGQPIMIFLSLVKCLPLCFSSHWKRWFPEWRGDTRWTPQTVAHPQCMTWWNSVGPWTLCRGPPSACWERSCSISEPRSSTCKEEVGAEEGGETKPSTAVKREEKEEVPQYLPSAVLWDYALYPTLPPAPPSPPPPPVLPHEDCVPVCVV